MLYDGLLVFALLMMVVTVFVAARGGEAVPPLTDPIFRLTLAITIYLFFVGFWTRSGSTLGMLAWGLRVETMDGHTPSWGAASLRFFAAVVSLLLVGLGFLWQLLDKDRLTWHDRISKTRVAYYPRKKKSQ